MGRRGGVILRSGQAEFESVQLRFDIDINIAQAKPSAINLCNETLLHLPEIILCLPVYRWKVTWPGRISRDAFGDLGLGVWGNMINILFASAREARAAERRKESTMGCR